MPDVTIADVMHAYAKDAVSYADRQLNITLDYSERSLEDVDRILAEYSKGELILPDVLSDSQYGALWNFCKMIGGYVGEVIIRNIGGKWEMRDIGDGAASIKLITPGGVEGSPPEAVWRALTEPYTAIVSYYRAAKAILGHGQESTEDGIRSVRLPPLSDEPPKLRASNARPWWKFWGR